MDMKTRGAIETAWDTYLKAEIIPEINWVEKEIPISSLKELMLGYVLGQMEALAIEAIRLLTRKMSSKEDDYAVESMLKRRLPEIMEKIERELGR